MSLTCSWMLWTVVLVWRWWYADLCSLSMFMADVVGIHVDRYCELFRQETVHPHHASRHDQHPPWTYSACVKDVWSGAGERDVAVWAGCSLILLHVFLNWLLAYYYGDHVMQNFEIYTYSYCPLIFVMTIVNFMLVFWRNVRPYCKVFAVCFCESKTKELSIVRRAEVYKI